MSDPAEPPLTAGSPLTTYSALAAVAVGVELGPRRRVFAQAIGWPGWCRAARDEPRALERLTAYQDRYRQAVGPLADPLGAAVPPFTVLERVDGDVTTDFGAPGKVMSFDRRPLEDGEPERLAAFLDACWDAFDAALAATPEAMRPVKPEVGRAPAAIRDHILGAQRAYLSWLVKPLPKLDPGRFDQVESDMRGIFRGAVRNLRPGLPFIHERHPGPYAVRRECWHVLDHAWELEDRLNVAG